jgi:hypothetical protein
MRCGCPSGSQILLAEVLEEVEHPQLTAVPKAFAQLFTPPLIKALDVTDAEQSSVHVAPLHAPAVTSWRCVRSVRRP